MIIFFFALFLSLLLSAFFSATETSFISSSEDKLYEIAAKGNKNAHKTLKLLEDKNGIIATALLADNLCNVLASSLITVITIELFGNMDNGAGFEIIIATFFATTMIFLFGEILPKAIALNNAENIAVAITPIFNVFMILFSLLD
jgi:Mg2+/Co2+ transporter CorB